MLIDLVVICVQVESKLEVVVEDVKKLGAIISKWISGGASTNAETQKV